jgi:hypothetical protein
MKSRDEGGGMRDEVEEISNDLLTVVSFSSLIPCLLPARLKQVVLTFSGTYSLSSVRRTSATSDKSGRKASGE